MSVFSHIFPVTEAQILTLIAHIKTDVQLFEADIDKALNWLVAQAPTIASDLQEVTALAATIGLAGDPRFAAAVTAANVAVAALNAMASAKAAGKTDPETVLQGYVAVKQATAAAATAAAIAAAPAK